MDRAEIALQLTQTLFENSAVKGMIEVSVVKNKDNLDATAAIVASLYNTIFQSLDKLV